ncbi:MAG: sigma-70 family RNA polymerase sigma factor [Saprospiraceae bacterium]|nr:sigma-70 family RNA polymerase sigma factor [Saprospiraceae bacterium]
MKPSENFMTALKLNEEWAFEELYQEYYPMVLKYVLNNSGTKESARDLFQEVLIALVKNVRNPEFELYSGTKLSTYIMSIAQNKWLASLVKNKTTETVEIGESDFDWRDAQDDNNPEDKELQFSKMERALENIGKECKEIIMNFYYYNVPLGKVADIMGYTQGFIRVKKNRCMNSLRELITNE